LTPGAAAIVVLGTDRAGGLLGWLHGDWQRDDWSVASLNVINMRTANALGLTLPGGLISIANEAIE
jgi:hypothetical protein